MNDPINYFKLSVISLLILINLFLFIICFGFINFQEELNLNLLKIELSVERIEDNTSGCPGC